MLSGAVKEVMAIGRPAGAGARVQAWKGRRRGDALEGGIVKESTVGAGSTLDRVALSVVSTQVEWPSLPRQSR